MGRGNRTGGESKKQVQQVFIDPRQAFSGNLVSAPRIKNLSGGFYPENYNPKDNTYLDDSNFKMIKIHSEEKCVGRNCSIHNPSDHKMVGFPTKWDWGERKIMRICEHKVKHPDPDDVAYAESIGQTSDHTCSCRCCEN